MPLFRCQPSSDAPGVCPPKKGRNESSKSSKSKPFPMIGSIYVSSQHPSFYCFLVLCQLPPATRSRMRSLPKGPALKALEANFHGFFHREKLKLRKKHTHKNTGIFRMLSQKPQNPYKVISCLATFVCGLGFYEIDFPFQSTKNLRT